VQVEKILLPHDQPTNPQNANLFKGPDAAIYANIGNIICKSGDGGRTWTSHKKAPKNRAPFIEVLKDGTFIALASEGDHPKTRAIFRSSKDEGRTWRKISEIPNPPGGYWGGPCWLSRLPDDTLLAGVGHPDHVFEKVEGKLVLKSGGGHQYVYRSADGGRTWSEGSRVHDWASEGDVTLAPSGKLLASLRYQRPPLPGDPPDLEKRTGSISPGWPYKHLIVIESDDSGRTWKNPRLLTTVFGQTRGAPVAMKDGTVIVVHDTRYGPGPAGSRAMISRDEGKTWENEVYYLDYTVFTGSYADSVLLDDGTVLSLVASSQAGNNWAAVGSKTDHYAIRWKPVRK
jgi:photosystem II stability/assembly factor-like uncharacterized protein